jgi:hypothetical protein
MALLKRLVDMVQRMKLLQWNMLLASLAGMFGSLRGITEMNVVSLGPKKKAFKSIRLAAEAAGVPYMTYYMRLRMGDKPATAASKPVRAYSRKVKELANA